VIKAYIIENYQKIDYYLVYMRKISFKVLIYAVFCIFGVMALGGCIMEPVGVPDFEGTGIVNIFNETDENLQAGNGKITGLDPNKYYMVEEWDENGLPKAGIVSFVSSTGILNANLTGIGRVSSGVLTGLANYHHYRVKAAEPLTGSVNYYYLSAGAGTALINAGVITLQPPNNPDWLIFPTPHPPSGGNYKIVRLPVSPAGSTEEIKQQDQITQSASAGKETDYVFFDNTGLFVLKVVFTGTGPIPPDPENLAINITLDSISDSPPQTDTSITYSQSDNGIETITVTNATQYDNPTTGIKWYINGSLVHTGISFGLDKSAIEYKVIGVYIITVTAYKGGIPYSAKIKVTVTGTP